MRAPIAAAVLMCNVQSSVVWEDMERSQVRGGTRSRPDEGIESLHQTV
jgi:hypothetical protein